MELRACPDCRRHIAVREISCPFCAAALPHEARGQLARAAVLGAALAACSGDTAQKPSPAPTVGSAAVATPPIDAAEPDALPIDAGVTDAPTDAAIVDAGVRRRPRPDAGAMQPKPDPDHRLKMPYGAPPRPGRIV